MRAVILAGGRGNRLAPYTLVIPKPLVPIGEMPILELLIRQLKSQGFEWITLSVGYLSSLIEAYCGDGSRWGIELDYVREGEPLGTAGFLGLLNDLAGDRVLVVNGDTLSDLDMGQAFRDHNPNDGATVWASRRTVSIEFGVIEANDEGALVSYTEKPEVSYDVSMGVNILSRWAIEAHVERGSHLDMPDLLRSIQAAGGVVRIRKTDAYWLDLGRPSDLESAVEKFAADPGRFLR
jgi:NDP-sugar pyrophosphorylase family protein